MLNGVMRKAVPQGLAILCCGWFLGSELRKLSKSEIIVFLRITTVTLEPESKVRNMRTATRGNGWRPRGGSSLAERRARPKRWRDVVSRRAESIKISGGAKRRAWPRRLLVTTLGREKGRARRDPRDRTLTCGRTPRHDGGCQQTP